MKMMKMMRLFVGVLVAAAISFGACGGQGDAAALKKEGDDRAYFFEALQAMEKLESGYAEFLIETVTPFGNANISNSVEFYGTKDAVVKSFIEGAIHPLDGKSTKFSVQQYMQMDKEKMTIYSEADKKWTKMTVEHGMKTQHNTLDQELVDRMIKSAVIKDQNNEWISLDITLNMQELQKLWDEALKEVDEVNKVKVEKLAGSKTLSEKEIEEFLSVMARGFDDFVINVVIDKKSKQIQGFYYDLSKPLQSGLIAAIDTLKIDAAQKNVYKMLAQQTSVLIQGEFSKLNQVKKFKIPNDIVKNAVEEKLPKQEDKKPDAKEAAKTKASPAA